MIHKPIFQFIAITVRERLLALPRPEFYYTRQGGEKEEMANSAIYTDEYDKY